MKFESLEIVNNTDAILYLEFLSGEKLPDEGPSASVTIFLEKQTKRNGISIKQLGPQKFLVVKFPEPMHVLMFVGAVNHTLDISVASNCVDASMFIDIKAIKTKTGQN